MNWVKDNISRRYGTYYINLKQITREKDKFASPQIVVKSVGDP